MDWPHDDQPIWMRTRSGPILSVPYPVELNDSPQIIHRQHTGREFCDMLVDQFEEMVEQSEKHPLVCNVSIHPYIFGYPFRLRPLRKALAALPVGQVRGARVEMHAGRNRGLLSDAKTRHHPGKRALTTSRNLTRRSSRMNFSFKIDPGLATRIVAAIAVVLTAVLPVERSDAAGPAMERMAKAADYPHKPIRIIDPYAAGGSTDLMARLIGTKLTERFGQPVIVDNRPGAGGNLGPEIVARATPDGYTLLMGVVTALAPSVSLYPRLGFDPMKDFAYVTLVAGGAYVIVVTPSVPAKSIAELIALAKAKPGQLSYGSSGVGSAVHLAGELFKSRAGVNILHVPVAREALRSWRQSWLVKCRWEVRASRLPCR